MTTETQPDLFAPDPEPVPPTPDQPLGPHDSFANGLYRMASEAKEGIGDGRGRLARLRRSLSRRGVAPVAIAEVGGLLPRLPEDAEGADRVLDTHLWVAALFATHATKMDAPWYGGYVAKGASFGTSCNKLRSSSASVDQRFAALLDARWEDLPYRLRQIVSLLAASDVGVRYERLLEDLLAWDKPGRPVQRAWSLDYWAPFSS